MPKVPTYKEGQVRAPAMNAPRVAGSALPKQLGMPRTNFQATRFDAGARAVREGAGLLKEMARFKMAEGGAWAGTSRELAAAGERMVKTVNEEREALQVMGALNSIADAEREKIAEFMKRQGEDAQGVMDEGRTWYNEQVNERLEGMGPRASTTFKQFMVGRMAGGLNRLQNHEMRQHELLKQQTADETLLRIQRDVMANPLDEETKVRGFSEAMGAIDIAYPGQANGIRKMKAMDSLNSTWIMGLIQKSPATALARLEDLREAGQVMPSTYAHLNGLALAGLENKLVIMESGIMAEKFGEDVKAAREELEKTVPDFPGLEKGAVIDRIISRTKGLTAEKKRAWEETRRKAEEKIVNNLLAKDLAGKLTMDELAGLVGKVAPSIVEHFEARIKRRGAEEDVETDISAWLDVDARIDTGEIRHNRDLAPYLSKLSKTDIQRFASKLTEGREKPFKPSRALTPRQEMDALLGQLGIEDDDSKYKIMRTWNAEMEAASKDKGRELTPDEQVEIGKELLRKEYKKNPGFFRRLFNIPEEQHAFERKFEERFGFELKSMDEVPTETPQGEGPQRGTRGAGGVSNATGDSGGLPPKAVQHLKEAVTKRNAPGIIYNGEYWVLGADGQPKKATPQ